MKLNLEAGLESKLGGEVQNKKECNPAKLQLSQVTQTTAGAKVGVQLNVIGAFHNPATVSFSISQPHDPAVTLCSLEFYFLIRRR
jgi:hypothetical protein